MLNSLLNNLLITLSEPNSLLVYGVFLSQLFVISFYIPAKWRKYRKMFFEEHPQSQYPKLYYQPIEVELKRQSIRKTIDLSIAIIGLIIFFHALLSSMSGEQLAIRMFLFAILQFSPFVLSQYWGRKNETLMAQMPAPKLRKTLLSARKLTDLVPLVLIITAALSYLVSVAFGLIVHWENFNTFASSKESISILFLLILNTSVAGYIAVLINKSLYAKRKDQNLSNEDRMFFMQKKIKQLIYSSILYSSFIFIILLIQISDSSISTIFMLTSIYMQGYLLIKVNPTKDRDFSVYKDDSEQ